MCQSASQVLIIVFLIASLFLVGLGPCFFPSSCCVASVVPSHQHLADLSQVSMRSLSRVSTCICMFPWFPPRMYFIYSLILPSTPFNRNSRGRGYDCGVYDKLLNMSLEKQRKRKGYAWKGRERERAIIRKFPHQLCQSKCCFSALFKKENTAYRLALV